MRQARGAWALGAETRTLIAPSTGSVSSTLMLSGSAISSLCRYLALLQTHLALDSVEPADIDELSDPVAQPGIRTEMDEAATNCFKGGLPGVL